MNHCPSISNKMDVPQHVIRMLPPGDITDMRPITVLLECDPHPFRFICMIQKPQSIVIICHFVLWIQIIQRTESRPPYFLKKLLLQEEPAFQSPPPFWRTFTLMFLKPAFPCLLEFFIGLLSHHSIPPRIW